MEEKVLKLNEYFGQQIAACEQRGRELQADERTDEATFEKVKANVYDIFKTILSVAAKTGKADPEAVRRFFVEKTGEIPANWTAAYDKAKQHGDELRMQIERIKLDTIEEIKENSAKIWEGAQ